MKSRQKLSLNIYPWLTYPQFTKLGIVIPHSKLCQFKHGIIQHQKYFLPSLKGALKIQSSEKEAFKITDYDTQFKSHFIFSGE